MPVLPNSRNLLTTVVQVVDPVTGKLSQPEFLDYRKRVQQFASDDRFVVVDGAMSWASLALGTLGDARFWWAIAVLSNVVDPFTELQPGVRTRGPSPQRLLFDILAPQQTST